LPKVEKSKILPCVSPLLVAAAFGQLTLFNDILQRVENKFPFDGRGRSTLDYAAINDCLNIYESIVALNRDIFPTLKINDSITTIASPLDMAVKHNSLKVCKFIVENNQVPTYYPRPHSTVTALHRCLHIAAFKGRMEIYKIIMEKVADKDPFFRGCTSLHLAAVSGNLEMCRLILENLNDKNPVSDYGLTPKDVAKNHYHLEIVKLFS
jgi:ankyrin repeat protein